MKKTKVTAAKADVDLDALITRYKNGDENAINLIATYLYGRQGMLLSKTNPIFLNTLSKEDCDEIYSSAIYSAATSFRLGKGHFISYFLLILSRLVIKAGLKVIRNQYRYNVISLDEKDDEGLCLSDVVADPAMSSDPKFYVDKKEFADKVDSFKKNQKKALVDKIIEKLELGYTQQEVAESLKISKQKAKNSIYAIKKGIRGYYQKDDKADPKGPS